MANEKTYPNYLMHYRTKGSKNGISTTKGYTAVGHRANGHWVNGHYVYYEDEAKQRAFRQGLAEARARNSAYENQAMVKRMENARKADVQDQKIYGKKIKGYTRLADISPYEKQRRADKYLSSSQQHQTAVNQHNANVSGMNAAWEYAQKKRKQTNIGASQAADASRMNAEARNRVLGSSKDSLKKGASNNWQQQANAAAGKGRTYDKVTESGIHYDSDLGNGMQWRGSMSQKQKDAIRNAGKKNNWQQQANAAAGKGRTYDKVTESGIHYDSDLGNGMQWRGSMSQKQKDARKALTSKTKAAKAESQLRNSRSDIGNAYEDFKQDAKNTFKALKSKFKKKKK